MVGQLTQTALRIDREQAQRQLQLLGYKAGDNIYMRFFVPDSDPRYGTPEAARKADKLNWEQAERYQNNGYGVYFVINSGGHTDAEVKAGRALFCEWDDRPIEDQILAWQSLNLLEPSMQVSTRKSIHNYWRANLTKEQWVELQEDLLACTQSDQKLKNPSRVLRLAGAWHIKPGCEPVRCDIIHESNKIYTYEELRAAIPCRQQAERPILNHQPSIPDDVPLYQFLTKDDRTLIDHGAGQGSRNSSGAKLARNLIGTQERLNFLGIRYSGDCRRLFDDYCHRCTPAIAPKEAESIWKSAHKDNPIASLSDDALENCAKAWLRNQDKSSGRGYAGGIGGIGSGGGGWRGGAGGSGGDGGDRNNRDYLRQKLPLREAVEKAREILNTDVDELITNIRLEEIREACGMSGYDWERKIIKPLKRDLEGDRFKLELLGLLRIDDPVERIRQQALMAPKYQMSANLILQAMQAMKQRTQVQEARALDLDELFDLEVEGLNWLIPGLLPERETIVLAGAPKAGKTLLAIDAAYAVATGESYFLGERVKHGRVLLVSTDESAKSTRAKLLNRGFRSQDKGSIKVLPTWDISQMGALEAMLEDFKPDLVIIDSLRRINKGSEISENSAEFADAIYTLKETLERYGAAGILIHHTNKDREALGVHRLRGSSAISGATWGVWVLDQIPKPDPNNKKKLIIDPKDPKRSLSVFARDIEGQSLTIELNAEDSSWSNLGELGVDEEVKVERETIEAKILRVLEANSHLPGLSGKELIELIEGDFDDRSIYNQLSRMESKRLISCKPAPGDKRYKIYSLPNCHKGDELRNATVTLKTSPPPPSPTPTDPVDDYYPENLTTYSLENSHQNSHQIVINSHQLDLENPSDDCSNQEPVGDSEIVINPTSEREGGGVKAQERVTVSAPQLAHYEIKNPDTDGWGEVVRVQETAEAPSPTEQVLKMDDGAIVGRMVRVVNLRGEASAEVYEVFSWCNFNGFYRLSDGEAYYPCQLRLVADSRKA